MKNRELIIGLSDKTGQRVRRMKEGRGDCHKRGID
jgi:hypothetical protein